MAKKADIVERARRIAEVAHRGQRRKYGGAPYFTHPARVADLVSSIGGITKEEIAAAYLHDVVEDTRFTMTRLRHEFGPVVAHLVGWLTNPEKLRNETRAVYKNRCIYRLRMAPVAAKRIKMCDRIDNLRDTSDRCEEEISFARTYLPESRSLLEAIGHADQALAVLLEEEIELLEIFVGSAAGCGHPT